MNCCQTLNLLKTIYRKNLLGDKKIEPIVDNFTECEKKREQLILQIQEYAKITTDMSEIARIYKSDRRTVKKYLSGNPKVLCKDNRKRKMDPYKNKIIEYINAGFTLTETIKQLKKQGCKGKTSSIRMYISDIIRKVWTESRKIYLKSISRHNRQNIQSCIYNQK